MVSEQYRSMGSVTGSTPSVETLIESISDLITQYRATIKIEKRYLTEQRINLSKSQNIETKFIDNNCRINPGQRSHATQPLPFSTESPLSRVTTFRSVASPSSRASPATTTTQTMLPATNQRPPATAPCADRHAAAFGRETVAVADAVRKTAAAVKETADAAAATGKAVAGKEIIDVVAGKYVDADAAAAAQKQSDAVESRGRRKKEEAAPLRIMEDRHRGPKMDKGQIRSSLEKLQNSPSSSTKSRFGPSTYGKMQFVP